MATRLDTKSARGMLDLRRRPRRLRRSAGIRAMVRETRLSPDNLMYPLFVVTGQGQRREVPSMPGVFQLSVDETVKEAAAAKREGIPAVLLFGLPDSKDAVGSGAADPEGPVQAAVRALKRDVPGLVVVMPSTPNSVRTLCIRFALEVNPVSMAVRDAVCFASTRSSESCSRASVPVTAAGQMALPPLDPDAKLLAVFYVYAGVCAKLEVDRTSGAVTPCFFILARTIAIISDCTSVA